MNKLRTIWSFCSDNIFRTQNIKKKIQKNRRFSNYTVTEVYGATVGWSGWILRNAYFVLAQKYAAYCGLCESRTERHVSVA